VLPEQKFSQTPVVLIEQVPLAGEKSGKKYQLASRALIFDHFRFRSKPK